MSFDQCRRLSRRHNNEELRDPNRTTNRHDGKALAFLGRHERDCSRFDRTTRAERHEFAEMLVERIADTRNLWCAAKHLDSNGDKAPGPNRQRLHQLLRDESPHVWAELRKLRKRILDGTYVPEPARKIWIPKSSGKGMRPIEIMNWQDQCVQRAIVQIIQPLIDPHLDELSLGYRPGRDRTEALAKADIQATAAGQYVWVCADLKDAFTAIPHRPLLESIDNWFGNSALTELIRNIIGAHGRTRGVVQGGSLSALLLNVYLDRVLDKKWRKTHPELPLIRVADDLLILCTTMEEATQAYTDLQRILQSTGMKLKGTKEGDIVNLNTGETAEWLGYAISLEHRNIAVRASSRFQQRLHNDLKEALAEADGALRVEETLRGKIDQLGPCYPYEDHMRRISQLTAAAHALGVEETPTPHELLKIWERAYARDLARRGLWGRLDYMQTTDDLSLQGQGSADGQREPAELRRGRIHDSNRGLHNSATSIVSKSILVTNGVRLSNGTGGWAIQLTKGEGGRSVSKSGTSERTTKNRIELKAVIFGLQSIEGNDDIQIITRCEYVADGIRRIIDGSASDVEALLAETSPNWDLWRKVSVELDKHRVTMDAGNSLPTSQRGQ